MICSDEFGPLGRAEAQVLGLPGLPLVAIPHPLADNKPHLVEAKAAAIVDELVAAITGDAMEVTAVHRGRFQRLTQRRLEAGELCLDESCALDPALPSGARPEEALPLEALPAKP